MMWTRRAVVVTAIAFAASVVRAEPGGSIAESPRLYQPQRDPQATPIHVEVLDGTGFKDVETGARYRLYGVATCLPGQVARLGRQLWPCGTMAAAWLVTATLGKWLSCATLRDEAGEHLARCASAEHPDLAAAMITDGVAVTTPPTAQNPAIRAYTADEREARKAYRGLWASAFEMPWDLEARRRLFEAAGPKLEAGR